MLVLISKLIGTPLNKQTIRVRGIRGTATGLNTVAIMLAAGRSRRFGADKRLHKIADADSSLLQQSLAKPLALNLPTLLVLRPDDADFLTDLIGSAIQDSNLSIIYAPEADLGMGHSLAHAFKGVGHYDAALVMLADMPWVEPSTIESILSRASPGKIVIPTFDGRRGHPVLFGNKWFKPLSNLKGDSGAKDLLRVNQTAIVELVVPDEGVLRDVDTPA